MHDMLSLSVNERQSHLISNNTRWISQAIFNENSITFGIYSDNKPAGLISIIDPRLVDEDDVHFTPNYLYVWRLMIDNNFQRQGIGEKAVSFAKDYSRIIGLNGITLTTMDTMIGNALPLYKKCGFLPTGRRLNEEIELIFKLKGFVAKSC